MISAKMTIVSIVVVWGMAYLGWSIYYQSTTNNTTIIGPKIECPPPVYHPLIIPSNESHIQLYGEVKPLTDSLFRVTPKSDALISLVGYSYSGTRWLSCVTELYSKRTSFPYISDPPCFNIGREENQIFGRINHYTFENGNDQEVDGKIVLVIRDPLDVLFLAVRDNAIINNIKIGDIDIFGITELIVLNYGKFLSYWLEREDVSSIFLLEANTVSLISEVKNKITPLLKGQSALTEEEGSLGYPTKGSEEEKIVASMKYISYLYNVDKTAHDNFDKWWMFDGLDQLSRHFISAPFFFEDSEYASFREDYKKFLWTHWLNDERRKEITEKYLSKFSGSLGKKIQSTPEEQCTDNIDACVENVNKDILEVSNSINIIQNLVNEKYVDKVGHLQKVKETVQKFQEEIESAKKFLSEIVTVPSEKLRIFIGIFSTHNNLDRREAIRETWVNLLKGTSRQDMFKYKFILAKIRDEALIKKVEEENKVFNDMVIFDTFNDHYRNLSLKTLELMTYATKNYDTEYIMKIDDDSFLRLDFLMDHLEDAPRTRYYFGKSHGNYYPDRGIGSKWYISPQEYPHNGPGPILIAGPGYLMSRDCAEYLAKRYHEPNYHPIYLEDVNTCLTLAEIGVSGIGSPRFYADAYCQSNMILNHYVWPDIIRRLYRNTLKGNPCVGAKRSIDIVGIEDEDHECVSPPTQIIYEE